MTENYDLAEFNRKKAEIYNAREGSLTGKDCSLCHNKGQIMIVREDGTTAIRECKCMAFRNSLRRLERSGLRPLVSRCTFDRFETPEQWQREALRRAKDYAKAPEGRWFLAAGQPGSGKTHLCVAICRELMLRGLETRYMLWRDEIPGLKAAINDSNEYQRLIEPLKRVPVLYIDDFLKTGKGDEPTAADLNVAFELLNARYINRELVTILSTEWIMSALLALDEAVGSRIYERTKESKIIIERDGSRNWRMRAAGIQ